MTETPFDQNDSNLDWLADALGEAVKKSNEPRTALDAHEYTCPYVFGEELALCGGKRCPYFVRAPVPDEFTDGLPVASSCEKAKMSPELRAQHERGEKWAVGMYICGRPNGPSQKAAPTPKVVKTEDEWFDATVATQKARISGVIVPQLMTTAKIYALFEIAFESAGLADHELLTEAFHECLMRYKKEVRE